MDPQPLHRGRILHSFWQGQQDPLDDTAKVSQVEEIVGLGWSGQEVVRCLFVDFKGSQDYLVHTGLEFTGKTSAGQIFFWSKHWTTKS